MPTRTLALASLLAMASIAMTGAATSAATVEDLNHDSGQALGVLYQSHPVANRLSRKAKAILIFPNMVEAGGVAGGGYSEGELIRDTSIDGYYSTAGGSWDFPAGAPPFSYAVFLMTDKAVRSLNQAHGWKFGADPTVIVVDKAIESTLSTATPKGDAYAFVFSQQDLKAGASLEGATVSKLRR